MMMVDPSAALYNGDPLRPIIDQRLQVAQQDPTGEVRGRYTESLRMLGIDPRDRDVRFVARSCGHACDRAWDLSCLAVRAALWCVTIDGVEVGSLSHLRQVGGVNLDRMPVIVDYSLERLSIVAAGYATEEPPAERDRQMSVYVLRQDNHERTCSLMSLHADECEAALADGLYFSAYDHVLACLRLLEVLDATGDLSAKQRAARVSRISDLAKGCANAYLEAANA